MGQHMALHNLVGDISIPIEYFKIYNNNSNIYLSYIYMNFELMAYNFNKLGTMYYVNLAR